MPRTRAHLGSHRKPTWWRRLSPFALAAAGGCLYFLGHVGFGLWPLVFVFLVPLWLALEQLREREAGVAGVALAGLAFAAAAYTGGYHWLWRIVDVFLDGNAFLGAALWVGHGAWFALAFAVYAVLFHAVRHRGWPIAVAGAGPLLAVEWLHPQLFPVYAGSALVNATRWVQTADLGGPLLVSGMVAALNAVAFATWSWLRGQRERPVGAWLAGASLACAALVYGHVREAALEAMWAAAPALRVGVVQANLGLMEKRAQGLVAHRRYLAQTRALLAGGDLDLVVWPETAYVRGLRRPLPISGRLVREDLDVPLLFGGTSVRQEGGRRVKTNSTFLVGDDEMIRDAYDKNLLIPLAEFAPFSSALPGLTARFPHALDFVAAESATALALGSWRIATPICYEAVRPSFVRRMVRETEAHLLVTVANDAWFGDSREPWIHLALARLRAVEHRRFLVRSTNSGVSAVVDPLGRVVTRSGLLTRENLRSTVRLLDGTTLYGRLGDWPGGLATAVTVLALLVGRAGRGCRGSSGPPDEPAAGG